MLEGLIEPSAGLVHEVGAEPEHENAELLLGEGAIPVKVSLSEHAGELVVPEVMEAQEGAVPAEAVEGDYSPVLVHEEPEPIAQLPYQPLSPEPVRHRRQQVLELERCRC